MKEGNQWIMIARVVHYSSKCLMTVCILILLLQYILYIHTQHSVLCIVYSSTALTLHCMASHACTVTLVPFQVERFT